MLARYRPLLVQGKVYSMKLYRPIMIKLTSLKSYIFNTTKKFHWFKFEYISKNKWKARNPCISNSYDSIYTLVYMHNQYL